MIGTITATITLLAGGTAIGISIGNIVFLRRIEQRNEATMMKLRRIKAALEEDDGGDAPEWIDQSAKPVSAIEPYDPPSA